jgi:Protein of unknown function (DUF2877)
MLPTATDTIPVVRVSPDAARRLAEAPPRAGRVHSVFDRALNLAWHDGRLLTLQGSGPLVAPFAIELRRLPRIAGVGAGTRAWRQGHTLVIDDLALDWRGAVLRSTAMPEGACGPARALSVRLAEAPAPGVSGLGSARALAARARLAEGLRRLDAALFVDGAFGLLGLGAGLTPAGDDFLVGALAVLHRFGSSWLRGHPEIADAVGTRAATATTIVACEFVTHALAGHFAESLIDLLTAESADAIERAAARVRHTGATSGADTLAGVRVALESWAP